MSTGCLRTYNNGMKTRFFIVFFLFSIFSFLLSGCSKPDYIIGYSAQIRGIQSDIGVDGRNGATFALEIINSKGGINGHEVRLISRDDGITPADVVEADKELIQDGALAIIGHITSTKTLAAAEYLKGEKIPLIAPVAASPKLDEAGPHLFRMNSSSSKSAAAMAVYARDELDCRIMIPVLDENNKIFASSFSEDFGKEFIFKGGKFLEPIWFSSVNLTDWSDVIKKILNTGATGILIISSATDAASFANELPEKYCLFSTGWAYTEAIIRFGGQAVEGMIFADTFSEDFADNKNYNTFVDEYLKRFGKKPSFPAIQSFDAATFIAEGLVLAGEEKMKLTDALSSIRSFQGAYSEVELSESGEALRPVLISKIVDGEFCTVKEIPVKDIMKN